MIDVAKIHLFFLLQLGRKAKRNEVIVLYYIILYYIILYYIIS